MRESSTWEGEGGMSGLSLIIKKLGTQKANERINSDNKYIKTWLLYSSEFSSFSLINIKFHKKPINIPIVSDKQHNVHINVLISSLNQFADIFPGEFNNAG